MARPTGQRQVLMIPKQKFFESMAKWARVGTVSENDNIFRDGLDMSSIAFTEFIMEIEEEIGTDIDPDRLDASIRTVGQLYHRIAEIAEAGR